MIKETEKKPATLIINPDTGLDIKKNIFISIPYVPGLSEEFGRIFQQTYVKIIFKRAKLKSILMHHKDKNPS